MNYTKVICVKKLSLKCKFFQINPNLNHHKNSGEEGIFEFVFAEQFLAYTIKKFAKFAQNRANGG
jgi:hypothetical protein